jgi:hypothetical protein
MCFSYGAYRTKRLRSLAGGHFPEISANDIKWQAMFIRGSGIEVLVHKVNQLAGGVSDICASVCDTAGDEEETGYATTKE